MNLQALKTELDSVDGHPVTGPYSSDAATAANELNAVNRTRKVPIDNDWLLGWASNNGILKRVKDTADDLTVTDEQLRSICLGAVLLINHPTAQLEPGNSDHVTMITKLVQSGIMSVAEKDELVVKATEQISRVQELSDQLNAQVVEEKHVRWARLL